MPLGLIPPIGLEIPVSCHAVNVPFQVNVLGLLTLQFPITMSHNP